MIRRILIAAVLLFAGLWAGALPYDTLDLSFVGDLMAHNVNYRMKDYTSIYQAVTSVLKADDLTFGNLEFVIDPSKPPSTYPQFNVSPSYVDAAIDAGIDVFSLANNHSYDWGAQGLRATLRSMATIRAEAADRGRVIYVSGLRDSGEQPLQPTEIWKKGWRIGYLALTEFSNVTPDQPLLYMVDYHDQAKTEVFLEDLQAMTGDYDLFVVSFHGGKEYADEPSPEKRRFFYALLDAGVHIVHGHHPHVVQPVETIDYDGHQRLILYSCGNFISGQSWRAKAAEVDNTWARTGDSYIYSVTVTSNNPGPSVILKKVETAYHYKTADGEVVIDQLRRLAEADTSPAWRQFFSRRLKIGESYQKRNPIRTPHNLTR